MTYCNDLTLKPHYHESMTAKKSNVASSLFQKPTLSWRSALWETWRTWRLMTSDPPLHAGFDETRRKQRWKGPTNFSIKTRLKFVIFRINEMLERERHKGCNDRELLLLASSKEKKKNRKEKKKILRQGRYYFKSEVPKVLALLRLTAQKSCPLQKCVPKKL